MSSIMFKFNVRDAIKALLKINKLKIEDCVEEYDITMKDIDKMSDTDCISDVDISNQLVKKFNLNIDGYAFYTGEIEDDELSILEEATHGIVLDEYSHLAIEGSLQSLERDERYAPCGIKSLGYYDEDDYLRPSDKLTAPYIDGTVQSEVKYQFILPRCFFYILATNKDVSKKTIDYILSPMNDEHNNLWFLGIPYVLHECYAHGIQSLYKRILDLIEQNNSRILGIKRTNRSFDDSSILYMGEYATVNVLKETIELAIERNDLENIERLNSINKSLNEHLDHQSRQTRDAYFYDLTSDQLRILRARCNTKLSDIDKHIESSIHYGILNVGELVPETWEMNNRVKVKQLKNDFVAKYINQITNTIKKYPICCWEAIIDDISRGEWDKLEMFKDEGFIDTIIESRNRAPFLELFDNEAVKTKNKEDSIALFEKFLSSKSTFSKLDWKLCEEDNKPQLSGTIIYTNDPRKKYPHSGDPVAVKEKIIHDLGLQYQVFNKTEDLTKEYFSNLLEKGKYRDVLIDLCVRLETILDAEYENGEDLMKNLETYCNELDEGNRRDRVWKLLSKLVRCRNNAVHRNTSDETMSMDELNECIDYICKL